MAIITLMTDFGIKDGNVGVMKGVILGIAPQTQILDLSHVVSPQNIVEAGLILARSAPYFPDGSIHVVVVDPGVGTNRRPIAARLGTQIFVGPDNGLVTFLLDQAERANVPTEFVHLDRPEFWLPDVSFVFHGRDIFAPIAAHLANGKTLQDLGTLISDPVRLVFPQPERISSGLRGEIIHIDHFGNVASNIRVEHLLELLQNELNPPDENILQAKTVSPQAGRLRNWIDTVLKAKNRFTVQVAGIEIWGLVTTFGERAPGQHIVLFGSTGNLIVSIVNGSFALQFGVQTGQPIEIRLHS